MNFGRVPMTSRSAYGNPLAVPGGVHSSGTPGTPGHTPSLSPQRDISTAHHPPPPSGNYSASSLGAPTATQPVRGGVGTLDAYQNLSKIGEGTYGFVYQATDRRTGEKVALKKLIIHKESYGFPLIAIREIKFLKILSHRGIVHLKEVVSSKGCEDMEAEQLGDVIGSRFHQQQQQQRSAQGTSSQGGASSSTTASSSGGGTNAGAPINSGLPGCGHLYLVFEYVEHDLAGLIASRYKFNLKEIQCLMQQLFDALGYLHDQKIMHRDIKSSNILISNKLYLKLADFGLARSVDNIYSHPAILGGEGADAFDYDYHEPTRSSASSVGNRRGGIGSSSSTSGGGRMDGSMHSSQLEPQYTNNVITMWYRPPEVLLGAVSYGCGVDVWSAGCVLAEMAIMRPLMPGKTEMEQFDMICRLTGTPSEATWPDISQLPHAEYMLGEVAKYTSDIRSTLTNVVSSSVIDILERILVHDPSRRCSARAALGMRFFHACPKPHEMPPLSVPGGASFHEFETLHKRRTTETTAAAPSDTHPPSTHVSSGGSTSGLGGAGSISTSVVSSGGSSSSSSNSSGSGAPKSGWSEATFTTSGGASKPHGLPGSYAAALMRPGDSGTSAQNIQKLPRSDPPSSRFGSMPPHHGQGSGYNAPAISTAAPANTSGTAGSYAHEAKRPRYDNWSSGTRR